MSLLDYFGLQRTNAPKKEFQKEDSRKAEHEATPACEEEDAEYFYFENAEELALYGSLCSKGKNVYWLSGDNYVRACKEACALFDQKKYRQAINAYQKCFSINPIAIAARFEICEAYIKLTEYENAKKTLLSMKDFLVSATNIARFYRRMGFIATEEKNYLLAVACNTLSLKYEDAKTARDEILYLVSVAGPQLLKANAETEIQKAGIPILKPVG